MVLAFEYALFVFVAACGVIQVSAAHAGLRGLLVLPSRRAATALGALLTSAAFGWFFGLVDRNVWGLEGLEQTVLFVPSVASAIAVTVVASSLVHRRRSRRGGAPLRQAWPLGLEALREMSYLEALRQDAGKAAQ